jgi:hypothetical protein
MKYNNTHKITTIQNLKITQKNTNRHAVMGSGTVKKHPLRRMTAGI